MYCINNSNCTGMATDLLTCCAGCACCLSLLCELSRPRCPAAHARPPIAHTHAHFSCNTLRTSIAASLRAHTNRSGCSPSAIRC